MSKWPNLPYSRLIQITGKTKAVVDMGIPAFKHMNLDTFGQFAMDKITLLLTSMRLALVTKTRKQSTVLFSNDVMNSCK